MNLGETIKSVRKERGLTQGELAGKVGITQAALSAIETKKVRPSFNNMDKIIESLGVSEGYVYLRALGLINEDVNETIKNILLILSPNN